MIAGDKNIALIMQIMSKKMYWYDLEVSKNPESPDHYWSYNVVDAGMDDECTDHVCVYLANDAYGEFSMPIWESWEEGVKGRIDINKIILALLEDFEAQKKRYLDLFGMYLGYEPKLHDEYMKRIRG